MYAVIRAGGKQYRVSPGDVIRVETTPAENGTVEFGDILAVSGEAGKIGRPEGEARVVGSVVENGRADKILVFHYKRKKQYKKLRGHRQAYSAVRITEIAFDGQSFKAPELPAAKPKKAKSVADTAARIVGGAVGAVQGVVEGVQDAVAEREVKAMGKGKGGSRPTGKKSAGKKGGPKKSAGKKGPKK
ncbi:MAG TPA: 50S ribosomal protein L21 [Terriglobales bacterium]|nr:50S ribosomal protein L21 [Terriglobales bacterium]